MCRLYVAILPLVSDVFLDVQCPVKEYHTRYNSYDFTLHTCNWANTQHTAFLRSHSSYVRLFCLVLVVCRSYEKKSEFAAPPRKNCACICTPLKCTYRDMYSLFPTARVARTPSCSILYSTSSTRKGCKTGQRTSSCYYVEATSSKKKWLHLACTVDCSSIVLGVDTLLLS
jgi:hypothetical protein